MRKRVIAFGMTVVLMAASMIGCTSNYEGAEAGNGNISEADAKKAGCILGVGGLDDGGFNDLIYEGLMRAQEEDGIPFDYEVPVEAADFETLIRDMAATEAYEVVICAGVEAAEALEKVAAKFPDQKFAIIDGSVNADNVVCYVAKEEEVAFLAGSLAGLMKLHPDDYQIQDNHIIGFITAMNTPAMAKWSVGYEAGAKYVNKDIQCLKSFVGGSAPFEDSVGARKITVDQYEQGADIIAHAAGGAGEGVLEAAESRQLFVIGCDANQNAINPDVIVASMIKSVDTVVYNIVKSACTGNTLKVGSTVMPGLADEGMDLAFSGSRVEIRRQDREAIEAIKEQIIEGEIKVPVEANEIESFVLNNQFD